MKSLALALGLLAVAGGTDPATQVAADQAMDSYLTELRITRTAHGQSLWDYDVCYANGLEFDPDRTQPFWDYAWPGVVLDYPAYPRLGFDDPQHLAFEDVVQARMTDARVERYAQLGAEGCTQVLASYPAEILRVDGLETPDRYIEAMVDMVLSRIDGKTLLDFLICEAWQVDLRRTHGINPFPEGYIVQSEVKNEAFMFGGPRWETTERAEDVDAAERVFSAQAERRAILRVNQARFEQMGGAEGCQRFLSGHLRCISDSCR